MWDAMVHLVNLFRKTPEDDSGSEFVKAVRTSARKMWFRVVSIDESSATLDPGRNNYKFSLSQLSDGRLVVTVLSRRIWAGQPPDALRLLLNRMNSDHPIASFSVEHFEENRVRCVGRAVFSGLDMLKDTDFWHSVGKMSGQMAGVEKQLVKHGYA